MVKRKKIRTRGKIQLSRYFQEFKEGDKASVVREKAMPASFPERLQGRTGIIEGKRGRSYVVNLNDQNKEKKFLINPIHLKKIKEINKNDKN